MLFRDIAGGQSDYTKNLHALKVEMLIVPSGRWNPLISLAVFYVQIVSVGTRENVSCVIVECVTAPSIAVIAGYFFVDVAFHIALFLLFVTAKIATISIFPKIILLSLIKIVGCSLKIAIRNPKISVLKIPIHSLKIAGLKIIARVCVCVCMWVRGWVRGCAPHFAEVSKIVQDATRAGATTTEHKNTSDHQSRSTSGTQRTRIAKRNYKNNSK